MTSMTHATAPRRRSDAATHVAPTTTSEAAQDTVEPDLAAKDARETRLLLTIVGAAALVVLVFFLVMMWILSGYGPTVQV